MSVPVSNSEVKKQWSSTSTFSCLHDVVFITDGTSVPFGWLPIARGDTDTDTDTQTGMVELRNKQQFVMQHFKNV